MKKYYLIVNNVVAGVSSKKINSSNLVIESDEIREIGDSYIDGVFGDPVKTFESELADLNAKYESDLRPLVEEYNLAVARDGVTETVKVNTARAKITALDNAYDTDFANLIIKYS